MSVNNQTSDETTMAAEAKAPLALLLELTHRCPLQCPYCSNPLKLEKVASELNTEQWMQVLDQAAEMGILQVHFSGGEPALRKDLENLVAHAEKLGLYSNLITSAVNLSQTRINTLAEIGLGHIQVSIQDSDEKLANTIGGHPNGYQLKLAAAKHIREAGIPLTINAPVHRLNIDHLEASIQMAVDMDASRIEVAHVQYYGWAYYNRKYLMPTRKQLDWATEVVNKASKALKGILSIDYVVPDYYAKIPKSCMSGWGRQFLNITPSGLVLPCHAAESITSLSFDSVVDKPLNEIWKNSEAFQRFRGTAWMPDTCKKCDRREIDWGGCRCQAFAITGDASNMDPACQYSPFHQDLLDLATSDASSTDYNFTYRRINIFNES